MEDRLRAYMDELFERVKPSKKSVELKEEILQNLTDKYYDLVSQGKTSEAAYNIAVASIGDVDELLGGLMEEERGCQSMSEEEIQRQRKKSAVLTAVAIMMYILSVLPPILIEHTSVSGNVGAALMFIIIAIATGLIVYGHLTRPRYRKSEDSMVEDFKEWQDQNDAGYRAYRAVNSALWSITTVTYFVISFFSGAWYITWVIFLIGSAVQEIIKAGFEMKRRGGDE